MSMRKGTCRICGSRVQYLGQVGWHHFKKGITDHKPKTVDVLEDDEVDPTPWAGEPEEEWNDYNPAEKGDLWWDE